MDVQPHLLNLSAFIDQHLDQDLPLSTLARRVGLSQFHFHRKFGAYFGESLHQHIKRLRLERAAFALTHGSRPVSDIARESGYKTVSAFSHAFSTFAGQSPTRFRGRLQQTANGEVDDDRDDRPAWIGELAPQEIAFVRAEGDAQGVEPSIADAIRVVMRAVSAAPRNGAGGVQAFHTGDQTAAPLPEMIAATTDLFRVANRKTFRIDVGVDAALVPERQLGRQKVAGGRYARFDLRVPADQLIDRCYRATTSGLRRVSETARALAHFVRFSPEPQSAGGGTSPVRLYQLFVPLED